MCPLGAAAMLIAGAASAGGEKALKTYNGRAMRFRRRL